jgi:hypothetical protein
MMSIFLRAFLVVAPLLAATAVQAQPAKPNRIDIQYVPPKSADHQQIYDLLRQQKALEKLRELLSPLRLPRRLLLKTEGCEGISNAWYDGESVTVCYEYLDDLWKNVPQQTTPGGVAPIDALIGPVADVFLHEAGHAVFDILKVPLFGREEDAADQFSIYIMLRFPKDEARRLILGNAFQYKGDLKSPEVTISVKKFADAHGTPSQRFFNVLCVAYGADPELFKDFVSSGALPQDRAEGCEDEYQQVAYAFGRLIRPHVDQKLARKLHRSWLPDISTKPKRKQTVPPRAAAQ